jgi:hypothetical protein
MELARDFMVDAVGEQSRPLGTHERRLQKLFGDAYPRASIPKPKGYFPLPSERKLANLVGVVQNGLVASSEEGFKDYEYLHEVTSEILAHGYHYPTNINQLAIEFALRRPSDELLARGAILLEVITRHLNGQAPEDLIPTDGSIEAGHLVHYASRLQNNRAGYAYASGNLEAARECLSNVVALQALDPSTPEIVKLDRQYSLAGILLEEAYRVFEETLIADQSLGAGRLQENADDHPLLHAMMAVFASRQAGDRR